MMWVQSWCMRRDLLSFDVPLDLVQQIISSEHIAHGGTNRLAQVWRAKLVYADLSGFRLVADPALLSSTSDRHRVHVPDPLVSSHKFPRP